MPHSVIALCTTEWHQTGTWRYLRPRYVELIPACQGSCPTANDIESWIRLFEEGRLDEAWDAATMENPFPGIMGRVCFHPCTEGCNRREMGGTVNIPALERALADAMGKAPPPAEPFVPRSGKRVAVVGSGPAGLAAAYHLARLGHTPCVFERWPKAGGMLRYGIPEYRLPKEILDRELSRLERMGVEFHLSKPVRDASHLQELKQEFAALFIASGAGRSRGMGIPEEKAAGVMAGLEFLRRVAEGKPPELGRRVLVVGGGNTAVDAARTARRFGREAAIVYRRSRAEMPAFDEEIRQAEEEGVRLETLLTPRRIVVKNGKVAGLECQQMTLGDPDKSGRREPVPIEGEILLLEAEGILTAIGEEIETNIIPSALPIERGALKSGPFGRTEWTTVFAGGDVAVGPRTVVDALASGKRSAIAIDCLLRGEPFEALLEVLRVADTSALFMSRYVQHRTGKPLRAATTSEIARPGRIAKFSDLNPAYFAHSPPAVLPIRTAKERLGDLSENHPPLSPDLRASELARCFHCGRCTECDNCYIYCPDVAIAKKAGGFEIDDFYCKGCGICPKECPRAAMEMIEEEPVR